MPVNPLSWTPLALPWAGAPTLALTGGAKARLDALTPPGHLVEVHLTLTDDHPWAQAFVIIEAIRDEKAVCVDG